MTSRLKTSYTAFVEFDEETGLYVGMVPALPGAHSQGATLDELSANLQEVVALVLEEKRANHEEVEADRFFGLQQIPVNL